MLYFKIIEEIDWYDFLYNIFAVDYCNHAYHRLFTKLRSKRKIRFVEATCRSHSDATRTTNVCTFLPLGWTWVWKLMPFGPHHFLMVLQSFSLISIYVPTCSDWVDGPPTTTEKPLTHYSMFCILYKWSTKKNPG